ncbi:hypothetical protein Nmel_014346 [Mimus melanotis]
MGAGSHRQPRGRVRAVVPRGQLGALLPPCRVWWVPCPAVVAVTRGPRAAPPALHEKTLVVAKPDALQRRLLGDIIQRFERRGFKLVAMKLLQVRGPAGSGEPGAGWPGDTARVSMSLPQADRRLVDQHYEQLRLKPFYPALVAYMTSGPVVAMVRGQFGGPGGRGGAGDSAVPVPQVWEGYNVVRCMRAMVGDSSAVGTIRGDLSVHITR